MKFPSRLVFVLSAIVITFFLNSCLVTRSAFYNFEDIKDYKIFPSRALHNDSVKFMFAAPQNMKGPKKVTINTNKEIPFDTFLEQNNTVAFLIIRNDTIYYEKYFKGYKQESIVPSFSMSKSVVSFLIGCALDDGLIKSVNDPVTDYLPELKKNGLEKLTIRHLLQMTSGIKANESYINPFGDAAKYYYGRNLRKYVSKIKLQYEPGTKFEYLSVNSEVLGMILERVLKTKTVTAYLQEKLWKPIGMEYDASWSLDKKKNGMEKTFCCINARARDFAKIGRLYLNNGNWNGKQIVSEKWVKEVTVADTTHGGVNFYKYQWWIPSKNGDYLAEGVLGQFIYVNPAKHLIIVRLGKDEGKGDIWWTLFTSLAKRM